MRRGLRALRMRLICLDWRVESGAGAEAEAKFQFRFWGAAQMSERRLIQISHVFNKNIKQQTME